MKLMNSFPLFSLFCVLGLTLAPCSLPASTNAEPWGEQEAERNAQEEITSEERSAQEEMSSSIYGRITNINMDEKILSLLPTDEVEDKEEEEDDDDAPQDYHFKSDTTLTGIDSLSELSPGDYVTLEYFMFRDKNRITEISFDKKEESESGASEKMGKSPDVLIG